MRDGLRIVVASYGALQFRFLQETLTAAGHMPVAYLVSRSMRPSAPVEPDLLTATSEIVANVPAGMDLLLPGSVRALSALLASYQPDLLLVFGFNWHLPPEALAAPRLGVLTSTLQRCLSIAGRRRSCGRSGTVPHMGVTVHRVTDRIDAGPIWRKSMTCRCPTG